MSTLIQLEDGSYALWSPSTGTRPISEEEAQQRQMSRGERFMGAVGDAASDTLAGMAEIGAGGTPFGRIFNPVGSLMDTAGVNPMAEASRDLQASNDPRQAARAAVDQPMAVAGTGAVIAADILAPLPPMSTGTRIGLRAADAGIDAARRAPTGAIDDSLSAARVADDAPDAVRTQPALEGFRTPEQLAELAERTGVGTLTTRGDDMALRARTRDELARAEGRRQAEELYRSDVITDRLAGGGRSINAIRDNAQDALDRTVAEAMGDTSGARFTPASMRRIRDEIGAQFDAVTREAGPIRLGDEDFRGLNDVVLGASADDVRLIESRVEAIRSDIKGGRLSGSRYQQHRTQLGEEIRRAANRGRFDRAQDLGEIQDILDEAMYRQLPQDAQETINEARRQYRIYKAMERSTATTNAGGSVNATSFQRALHRTAKYGRGLDEEFTSTVDTLAYLMERIDPSSGTAQRLLATIGSTRGAGLLGAGALGGGALLGD